MKSANEAEKALPKNATPSKLSKETAEDLDTVASPGRVIEAKSAVPNTNGCRQTKSALSSSLRDKYEPKRCDNNNKYNRSANSTPSKDRLGYEIYTDGNMSPSRHTPTRDRDGSGQCYRNNGNKDR